MFQVMRSRPVFWCISSKVYNKLVLYISIMYFKAVIGIMHFLSYVLICWGHIFQILYKIVSSTKALMIKFKQSLIPLAIIKRAFPMSFAQRQSLTRYFKTNSNRIILLFLQKVFLILFILEIEKYRNSKIFFLDE